MSPGRADGTTTYVLETVRKAELEYARVGLGNADYLHSITNTEVQSALYMYLC